MLSKYLKTILNGGVPEEPRDPLKEGLAHFEAGEYEQALPLLEEVIEADPSQVEVQLAVGRMGLERGQYKRAEQAFTQALEFDPRHPQLHYYLAELHHACRNHHEAVEHFMRATQCDADFTDAHIRLGMVLSELGRFDEAIKAFERAIFLDRAAVVARYHLAQVCVEQEDFRRALTQLHLVKELHPDYPPIYLLQGDIFQRLGDHRQAIVELTRAVELGAGDANVYWSLGTAHLALKQREKALRAFLKVTELEPELWPAYYEAALLQEGMKRYQQARESYRALLHAEEYRQVAQEAVARIDALLAEIAAQMAGEEELPQSPSTPGS